MTTDNDPLRSTNETPPHGRDGMPATHADARDRVVGAMRVRALRGDSREADFIFSTDAIDTYGERVEQVWRLERFRANPVALFGHNSRELPIGVAKNVGVESVDGRNALVGTIEFSTEDLNPTAELVWRNVEQGKLRAVSVGFIPHSVRFETEDDKDVLILSDNELLEISVVPIPANPEAVGRMRMRARGMNHSGASRSRSDEPHGGEDTNSMDVEETATPVAEEPVAAIDEPVGDEPIAEADDADVEVSAEDVENDVEVEPLFDVDDLDLGEASEAELLPVAAGINLTINNNGGEQSDAVALKAAQAFLGAAKAKTIGDAVAALIERCGSAETKQAEMEVDALIGVKFGRAERGVMLRQRLSDPSLFAEMMEQRPTMTLLSLNPAQLPADPTPVELAPDENGQGFADAANELAHG